MSTMSALARTTVFAAATLQLSAMAQAATCTAALQAVRSTPVVQYDPFRNAAVSEPLDIQLSVTGDRSDCALGLSAAGLTPGAGRSASLGGSRLIYRLFLDGIELINNPDAPLPITIGEGAEPKLTLRVEVPAGQIALAGTYSDPLTLRLVDLNNGNMRLGSEAAAVVTVAMESRAQINIAGSSVSPGSSFGFARLDFGALQQGGFRNAFVQVRSTSPVTLRVSSAHGGVMTRVGGETDRLSYDLRLDNQLLSLGGGPQSISRGAAPSVGGSSYPIEVRISGNPDALPAGDYRDLLTVDVEPI